MTGAAADPADNGQPTAEQAALAADAAAPVLPAAPAALPSASDDRPELAVGAAFAGGLVLGLLLKRLGR